MISLKFRAADLERLRVKLTASLPAEVRVALTAANQKSAVELGDLIHALVPKEPNPTRGQLADTLRVGPADKSPTGFAVSIGDAEHPYPAHLEFGHRDRGGGHVPAEPFFYPALRLEKKRFRSRAVRAVNAAFKKLSVP